jgi:hypothetical protein
MGEQLNLMLGNMKNAAERCDLMLQNKQMMQNREMRQETQWLQKHLQDMTNQIDVQVLRCIKIIC